MVSVPRTVILSNVSARKDGWESYAKLKTNAKVRSRVKTEANAEWMQSRAVTIASVAVNPVIGAKIVNTLTNV